MIRFLCSIRNLLLSARAWNIALRTGHIAAMAVLVGAYVFDAPPEDLLPALWWTVGTGVALSVCETGFQTDWFHQLRGVATIFKVALIGVISVCPFCSQHRVAVLMVVVVIASVASHMPARFRYYSFLRREVIRDSSGPGTKELAEEQQD